MKKILHISMIAPSRNEGGGGLGIYQSACAVQAAGEADYCGLLTEDGSEAGCMAGYRRIYPLARRGSMLDKLRAILHMAPTSAFASYLRAKRQFSANHYDVAYIDSSHQGYAARYAKRRGMHVVVRMHNIEQDYYKKELDLSPSLSLRMKYRMCCHQERLSMKYADTVIFITEADRRRAEELYPAELAGKRLAVMPICLDVPQDKPSARPIEGEYALITGSLWFWPNLEGIDWILREVWPALSERMPQLSLVIAGSRPCDELCERLAADRRVFLIDTPADMAPYFQHASVYLAPVFDGAGMKVKVAESLSYGLPLVGTSHVFVGYRDLEDCTAVANTAEEFIEKAIDMLHSDRMQEAKTAARQAFLRHYSMDTARRTIADLLETV